MQRRDRLGGRRPAPFLALAALLGAGAVLGGCESQARQDPLFVRNSTDSLVFKDTAFFRDRPLNESVLSSLALADYARVMDETGLLSILRRPGPFTLFAIPNQPLEALQARDPHLLDPASLPNLRRTLSYTIVPGAYTDVKLRQMIAKAKGPIGLRTLDGDTLGVSLEPSTNQFILSDPSGNQTRLWLYDMPQSNGVLYVMQGMLSPALPARPAR